MDMLADGTSKLRFGNSLGVIANSSMMKLLDCALFKVSHELWLATCKDNPILQDFSRSEKVESVIKYFTEHYTGMPATIQKKIMSAVKAIGEEIEVFILDYRKLIRLRTCLEIHHLNFGELRWTSHFTIDRVRTIFTYSKIVSLEGFECPKWIKRKWISQHERTKALAYEHFRTYSVPVFIYYLLCAKYEYPDFENYVTFFKPHFDCDTPEENALKFFLQNGNVECLEYFKNKVNPERHRELVSYMIEAIITHKFPWQFRTHQHVSVQIVVHFWENLEEESKRWIVRTHFWEFYQFLLNSPGTESLTSAIGWYKPSENTRRENRSYLEKTAQNMTSDPCEGQRFRCMFRSLYEIVRTSFSAIDVINLLEVVLGIEDIETASMMVFLMNEKARNELLDVIPKIWHDLWRTFVGKETFIDFFFEVQSRIFRATKRNN